MRLSKHINEYMNNRAMDRYAFNTMKHNQTALNQMVEVIGDMEIDRVTVRHMDALMNDWHSRGLTAETLRNKVSSIKKFFEWARDREYCRKNPMFGRRVLADPPKERHVIPVETFGPLLDSIIDKGATFVKYRDRALTAAHLYTMCRPGELLQVTVKDLNFQHREMHVRVTKSKKLDAMPMTDEMVDEMSAWISTYRLAMGKELDPDWYLFPPYQSSPGARKHYAPDPTRKLSNSHTIIQRCLRTIGWEGYRLGGHILRHSAATAKAEENMEEGYDGAIREVQSWLHHSSLQTTERYLSKDNDRHRRDKRAKTGPMYPSLKQPKKGNIRAVGE